MFNKSLFYFVLCGVSLLSVGSSIAQKQDNPQQVEISAQISRVAPDEAELVITAKIQPGLHIYAQSQPKPFLATKINVKSSDQIRSVRPFVPSKEPVILKHEKLGAELHEHEGTISWRSRLQLKDSDADTSISGIVFSQACEKDRCFAPTTTSFQVQLAGTSNPLSTQQETAAMELSLKQAMGDNNSDEMSSTHDQENSSFSLDELNITKQQKPKSAWSVLPLAFIAGFLLNFMPCVLPVVGLKLLSFVQQANSDRKRILLMNLAYTAGLLSVMMILASLAVFAGLGWGEQFSSTTFTVSLSAIVFAFGLSFLGVWEIPLPGFVGSVGGKTPQKGYGGAFSKGVLSTLLATPCSGPFLGAALAWAVLQPGYLTFSVFAAVGLGMASPYLVIGLFPTLIRFLPKPGNWMIAFKQIMGFIMLATVVYLMSFMPIAAVVPTVLLLLGVGIGVWYAGRAPVQESIRKQLKAWFVAAGMIVVIGFISFTWLQGVMQQRFERAAQRLISNHIENSQSALVEIQTTGAIQWEDYSPERLEGLLKAGRPVFIDFTADWCLTCKANEATAIETSEVAAALRESNAIALRADKTEPNPAVDRLLRQLGNSAASIPFYAVFPAGKPNEPILLDGIYATPAPFVKAIDQSKKIAKNKQTATVVRNRSENGKHAMGS